MAETSPDSGEITPRDRANKGYSLFLRRMNDVKAKDLAVAMELSDSQVSEIKTKKVQEALLLLAHVGLKCVPADYRCVDPKTMDFLTASSRKLINQAPHLIWDEGEA